jgi:hypothetical protein
MEEIVFWSPYGYVEVKHEDYNNQNKLIVPITNKRTLMYGSINV